MRLKQVLLGGVVAGAGSAVLALAYARFRREARENAARLAAGSRLLPTKTGLVEYAEQGSGPAVLVSHGSLGGYDQCLIVGRLMPGCRVLGLSRFGYLRAPLPAEPGPDAQADQFAGLLDALGIDRVAIMGASAGGPAAFAFALRYPDRCWGLIMISAVWQPPPNYGPRVRALQAVILGSDFLYWGLTRLGPREVWRTTGGRQADWQRAIADPEAAATFAAMFDVTPVSLRRAGQLNDLDQIAGLPPCDPGQLQVPVLVVHGTADPLAPYEQGAEFARRAPGCEILTIPEGGHLIPLTHKELVRSTVVRFLSAHAPQPASAAEAAPSRS